MANDLGILGSEFFANIILPFVLVFTVIFAVLEKSKILGDGKRQINSIVSLAMALILVGVATARGIITDLVPVMAVVLVVILVFMILYGFVGGTEKGILNKPLQIVIGIIAVMAIVITLLVSTGFLDKIKEFLNKPGASQLGQTVFFIIVIVAVFIVALVSGKKDGKDEK